jgi:RecJ-like exonuclease
MTVAIPEPKTSKRTCERCSGQGYIEGEACGYCHGRGVIVTFIVACPVHGLLVARDPDGGLLGQCDRCVGEAARAIALLSRTHTDPGGSVLAESAAGIRGGTV